MREPLAVVGELVLWLGHHASVPEKLRRRPADARGAAYRSISGSAAAPGQQCGAVTTARTGRVKMASSHAPWVKLSLIS